MSAVYRGRDRAENVVVAIKVLKQAAIDKMQVVGTKFEGELATWLNHPNVVRTYEYRAERGLYYIVMEFVEGENLDRLMRRNDPLVEVNKFDILCQIGWGLQYIHGRGLVHMDVCPKNVLIEETAVARIIDFGLSIRQVGKFRGLGVRSGTSGYMAPEQVKAEEVDERADIYAFGIVMYHLLLGRRPFQARDDFARMQEQLTVNPIAPRRLDSAVSPELEAVLLGAMAKNRNDRYPHMNMLLSDLLSASYEGEVIKGLVAVSPRPEPEKKPETERRRRRRLPEKMLIRIRRHQFMPARKEVTVTHDLSPKGMSIPVKKPLTPGSLIDVEIDLTGQGNVPIRIQGEALWLKEEGKGKGKGKGYLVGIGFRNISQEDRDRIARYISARLKDRRQQEKAAPG